MREAALLSVQDYSISGSFRTHSRRRPWEDALEPGNPAPPTKPGELPEAVGGAVSFSGARTVRSTLKHVHVLIHTRARQKPSCSD